MSEFNTLKEIIESGDFSQITRKKIKFQDHTCARLAKALLDKNCGTADLCALLHNFVSKAKLVLKDNGFIIIWNDLLPNRSTLGENLFSVWQSGDNCYFTTINNFNFPWVDHWAKFREFYEASLSEKPAIQHYDNLNPDRPEADIPVKYFTNHSTYNNESQKVAVRSLFQMEAGQTLIVTLATGAGKSLLFQLAALTNMEPGNMTIVVVPTISLAHDHERSFRDLVKIRYGDGFDGIGLAYTGGLDPEEKTAIKYRIKNGEQPIIFASPESILGSLLPSIKIANDKGFIKYFFIDETHIITDWGSNFRPAFQYLPPLIRNLKDRKRKTPNFNTILLTATLTPSSRQALNDLFGQDIPIIDGSDLRREIVFWEKECNTCREKFNRLLDLLKFLPRPILIYDTQPDDVENLLNKLKEHHYNRCSSYHGKTKTKDRTTVLKKWHSDELDIVVANSAFGLGVSKGNVRTVIHFCVPESLDRFYQEVGRSGRDQNTSISFMLFTQKDTDTARSLNIPKLITWDRARARFTRMWRSKKREEAPYEFNLGEFPQNLFSDSPRNQLWNKRTLILMHRANMIRMDFRMPDLNSIHANDDELPDYFSKSHITPITQHFNLPQYWGQFDKQRENEAAETESQFNELIEIIEGRKHYGSAFGDLYGINQNFHFYLSCPKCRNDNQTLNKAYAIQIAPRPLSNNIARNSPDYYYFHENDLIENKKKFLSALLYLITANDIREIHAPDQLLTGWEVFDYVVRNGVNFLITNEHKDRFWNCNRISIVHSQDRFNKVWSLKRPKHIVIFHQTILHPIDDRFRFKDLNHTIPSFENLMKELP